MRCPRIVCFFVPLSNFHHIYNVVSSVEVVKKPIVGKIPFQRKASNLQTLRPEEPDPRGAKPPPLFRRFRLKFQVPKLTENPGEPIGVSSRYQFQFLENILIYVKSQTIFSSCISVVIYCQETNFVVSEILAQLAPPLAVDAYILYRRTYRTSRKFPSSGRFSGLVKGWVQGFRGFRHW